VAILRGSHFQKVDIMRDSVVMNVKWKLWGWCCSDAMLLRTGPWSKRLDIRRAAKGEELSVNFMSQDWGII